jgi:hypothetical protein
MHVTSSLRRKILNSITEKYFVLPSFFDLAADNKGMVGR